jgi:hypothetical protein
MSDSLLDKMKRLNDSVNSNSFNRQKTHDQSRIGRMQDDVTKLHRFWLQFTFACWWVWTRILFPIFRFMSKPMRWAFYAYRHLWSIVVYTQDKYGALVFSKMRAGMFLTATVIILYMMPVIANLTYDTTMFAATVDYDEEVYLTNSQEIIPESDIHSVQGCNKLPCTDDNSIYYRVNPSLFNHIWSFITNKNWFFPDYVAAAVPPGVSKCKITSYGIRIKLLIRNADIYPDLLQASCQPINTEIGK